MRRKVDFRCLILLWAMSCIYKSWQVDKEFVELQLSQYNNFVIRGYKDQRQVDKLTLIWLLATDRGQLGL